MNNKIKKTTFLGLYTAAAVLLGYIDTLIPVFGAIPGVKLGLANLAIVLILYHFSPSDAFIVQIVRILIVGFLFGNLFSILFSMAGGLLSLSVMILMKRRDNFSIVGVSVSGGVSHNVGQIIIASVLVKNIQVLYYLPILIIAGVLTGILIGVLCMEIRKRLYRYD